MAVIATESKKVSDVLVNETWADLGYCRSVLTYNGAAKTFQVGEAVAAAGAVPAAATNVVGIVLQAVTAPLNTDTKVIALTRGPAAVKAGGLVLGALVVADVHTKLESLGIQVLSTIANA